MKLTRIIAIASWFVLNVSSAQEIQQRVPAIVELTKAFDVNDTSSKSTLETKLLDSVKLGSGSDLPKGTILRANITETGGEVADGTHLTLRFTEAQLKDGSIIPVIATIIDFASVPTASASTTGVVLNLEHDLQSHRDITDLHPIPEHMRLHSDASEPDSGTFIALKGRIKLPLYTKLELALGKDETKQASVAH